MPQHVFICEPGWEGVLADELQQEFADADVRQAAPGWKVVNDKQLDRSRAAVAFAAQVLPDAAEMRHDSISQWATAVGDGLIAALADHDGPWRLHLFSVPTPGGTAGERRCGLIREATLERLRKRQRRLLRTIVANDLPPREPGEACVQLGLLTADHGYLSVAQPPAVDRWRHCLSRFPGGRVEVPINPAAPARAMGKLVEALVQLGHSIQPGETCIDLGSSPGSWAFVALQMGATVTAVDRSPLRDDVMQHPRLTFHRGDAFAFEPPAPVDWLLCDVIAAPARSAELLAHWLNRGWCRRFCVTAKFRGGDQPEQLGPMKQVLAAASSDYLLRRLHHNKNEATAIGTAGNVPQISQMDADGEEK